MSIDSLNLHDYPPVSNKKFLFCSIDGDDTYESVMSDLRFCAAHLDLVGLISIDKAIERLSPGVNIALYDFLKENPDFRIVYILFYKVLLSRDRSIIDATFDLQNFSHAKINGEPVNIANRDAEEKIGTFKPGIITRLRYTINGY